MNNVITECSHLRKMGNAFLAAADLIERASGVVQTGQAPTTTMQAPKRVMSEATKRKIRAAHLKRKNLQVHEGGAGKKAA